MVQEEAGEGDGTAVVTMVRMQGKIELAGNVVAEERSNAVVGVDMDLARIAVEVVRFVVEVVAMGMGYVVEKQDWKAVASGKSSAGPMVWAQAGLRHQNREIDRVSAHHLQKQLITREPVLR